MIRDFPGTANRAVRQNLALKIAPTEQCASDPKFCAYNQTRERFVATGIEAIDDSAGSAQARLYALSQGSGNGLWILPLLEISPASICFPVDLVYLNNDCVVVDAVESFPIGSPGAASTKALSVIVFPSDTLAQGEIHIGDQLIVAGPDEMKHRLQRKKEARAGAGKALPPVLEPFARTTPEPVAEEPVQNLFAPLPAASDEVAPATPEVVAQEPLSKQVPAAAPPGGEARPWKKRTKPKDWLTRFLRGEEEPEDPRIVTRESLPGLIAYYFTGGTPAAQEVRDISPTGVYIVTTERWYPGTVVRLTLTDRRDPRVERSLTVNAKAVRFGSDGVGLEFILDEQKKRREKDPQLPQQTNGVDIVQVVEFLRNYRSSAGKT